MEKLATPARLLQGLLISLVLPLLFGLWIFPDFVRPLYEEPTESLLGLTGMWLILFLLSLHIRNVERRGWKSIGGKPLSIRLILLAFALGILLSLLVPAIYALKDWLGIPTAVSVKDQELIRHSPAVLLLGIITAAVTEEVLLRAYPLERLRELTGNQITGFALSLGAFVLLHTESWDAFHVLGVVLPLGLILTLLYLRTRNLPFLMIVHFVIDLPMVLGALASGGN